MKKKTYNKEAIEHLANILAEHIKTERVVILTMNNGEHVQWDLFYSEITEESYIADLCLFQEAEKLFKYHLTYGVKSAEFITGRIEFSEFDLPVQPLDLYAPMTFVRVNEDFPEIHPLPLTHGNVASEYRPRQIWRDWYFKEKEVLKVTAILDEPLAERQHATHLDALLSSAVMRWTPTVWHAAPHKDGSKHWLVPLPIELFCTTMIPRRNRDYHIPIWMSTPFDTASVSCQASALCIGHAETIEELLSYIHDFTGIHCKWTVEPMDMDKQEARKLITSKRPMPHTDHHFTPPYNKNWRELAQEQKELAL